MTAPDMERDAHLAAALRHAPDADIQPPALVRARIVAQALRHAEAARPHEPWARRAGTWLSAPWRLGGAGTLAAAVLASAVLWVGREQEPVTPAAADPRVAAPVRADKQELEAARVNGGAAAPSADAGAKPTAPRAPAEPGAAAIPPRTLPATQPTVAPVRARATPSPMSARQERDAADGSARAAVGAVAAESPMEARSAAQTTAPTTGQTAGQTAAATPSPAPSPTLAAAAPPAARAAAPSLADASAGAGTASHLSRLPLVEAWRFAGSPASWRWRAAGASRVAPQANQENRERGSASERALSAPAARQEAALPADWLADLALAGGNRWVRVPAPALDAVTGSEGITLLQDGIARGQLEWVADGVVVCDTTRRCEQARLEATAQAALRARLGR